MLALIGLSYESRYLGAFGIAYLDYADLTDIVTAGVKQPFTLAFSALLAFAVVSFVLLGSLLVRYAAKMRAEQLTSIRELRRVPRFSPGVRVKLARRRLRDEWSRLWQAASWLVSTIGAPFRAISRICTGLAARSRGYVDARFVVGSRDLDSTSPIAHLIGATLRLFIEAMLGGFSVVVALVRMTMVLAVFSVFAPILFLVGGTALLLRTAVFLLWWALDFMLELLAGLLWIVLGGSRILAEFVLRRVWRRAPRFVCVGITAAGVATTLVVAHAAMGRLASCHADDVRRMAGIVAAGSSERKDEEKKDVIGCASSDLLVQSTGRSGFWARLLETRDVTASAVIRIVGAADESIIDREARLVRLSADGGERFATRQLVLGATRSHLFLLSLEEAAFAGDDGSPKSDPGTLGEAVSNGSTQGEVRRLAHIVPTSTLSGIALHDLDKDVPLRRPSAVDVADGGGEKRFCTDGLWEWDCGPTTVSPRVPPILTVKGAIGIDADSAGRIDRWLARGISVKIERPQEWALRGTGTEEGTPRAGGTPADPQSGACAVEREYVVPGYETGVDVPEREDRVVGVLDELSADLAKLPNVSSLSHWISVEGYADPEGSFSYNLDLAERRAHHLASRVRDHVGKGWLVDTRTWGEWRHDRTRPQRTASERVVHIVLCRGENASEWESALLDVTDDVRPAR